MYGLLTKLNAMVSLLFAFDWVPMPPFEHNEVKYFWNSSIQQKLPTSRVFVIILVDYVWPVAANNLQNRI